MSYSNYSTFPSKMTDTRKRSKPDVVSFSKWTPDYFEQTFGFEFDINLSTQFQPSNEQIDPESVQDLAKHFSEAIESRGAITSLNESSKCDLIAHLFDKLVYYYRTKYDRSIRFRREHLFGDEYSSEIDCSDGTVSISASRSYVEFVISKHRFLFLIVEAKRDDIFQGLLQNAIELHQACQQNPEPITVFGAVTTLDNWIFTSYTATSDSKEYITNWSISKQMVFAPSPQQQTSIEAWKPILTDLTGILFWILKTAASQINTTSS